MRNNDNIGKEDETMDDVRQLIRYAGARHEVPAERMERARDRVAAHWEGVVAEKRKDRSFLGLRQLAIAASLLVVAGIAYLNWQPVGVQQVASVERVIGDVRIDGQPTELGFELRAGADIETAAGGRIALRLSDGQVLGIDDNSRLMAVETNRFELDSGAIYVDSGDDERVPPVHIVTRFGVATDVGTQFQVRILDDAVRVGVRDGRVEVLRQGARSVSIDSGHFVDVSASGDEKPWQADEGTDPWNWVASVVPEFEFDGATLAEYLTWYSKKRGLDLHWRDAASKRKAERAILSDPSNDDLSLEEGFEFARRIAPFEHEIRDSVLRVTVE